MKKTIERIKTFEGFSISPYRCTSGRWTIGFGYNFHDRGFETEVLVKILEKGFDKALAEELLTEDVQKCTEKLENSFDFFAGLNEPRKAVLADMCYQLGFNGLKNFKKMLKALSESDFEKASEEMKNSLWYDQSGRRSRTNAKQMRTGKWEEII